MTPGKRPQVAFGKENIIRPFAFFEADGVSCYVTEYQKYQPLKSFLVNKSWEDKLRYASQILRQVAAGKLYSSHPFTTIIHCQRL